MYGTKCRAILNKFYIDIKKLSFEFLLPLKRWQKLYWKVDILQIHKLLSFLTVLTDFLFRFHSFQNPQKQIKKLVENKLSSLTSNVRISTGSNCNGHFDTNLTFIVSIKTDVYQTILTGIIHKQVFSHEF